MEVVLRNVDGHDSHPHRTLHLITNSSIKVGRASKAGSRNVQPAEDNIFIESPVISRDHASLTLKADSYGELLVFLTDTGSMHGTYVDKEKLQKKVPCQLLSGSTVEFGANVYRNSETFHSRQYTVAVRPWVPSPGGAVAHGMFKVPDGESSDEESYGSSRMDESDGESDSSVREVTLLHIASNKENSIAGANESDPFQGPQAPAALENSTRLRTPSTRQRSGTPFRSAAPEDNSEDEEGQCFSPTFGLVSLDDDAPSVGYPEIPDSASVASFSNSSISDEYPYPLEAADMISHGSERANSVRRSVSSSSASAHHSEDGMDDEQSLVEIADSVAPTSAALMIEATKRSIVANDQARAVPGGHSSVHGFVADRFDPSALYIMNELDGSPQLESSNTLAPLPASIISKERGQLVQPMSLDRILDGGSKEKSVPPTRHTVPFSRQALRIPADAVTVESLLNLSSETGPDREWKGPMSNLHGQMSSAITPSKQQPTGERIHQTWASVPFDGLADGPSVTGQYRQGPFAATYDNSGIYGAEPGLSGFEIPEINTGVLPYYASPNEVGGKDTEKSKTSISISDILDRTPATPPSSGKKRKWKELDEGKSTERPLKAVTLVSARKEEVHTISETGEGESSSISAENPPSNALSNGETPERPPKRKRVHAGSALLGAVLGGVGVFAALAFLPESLFL